MRLVAAAMPSYGSACTSTASSGNDMGCQNLKAIINGFVPGVCP